jgi:serine/threonine-protein kinase
MPEPGAVLGGHRIVRELGVGPGGASYEAVSVSDGKTVVLKALVESASLDPAVRDAISTDYRALASLRSARIVTPRAAGEAGGLFWLIYPFEEAGSLAEHLAAGGPLVRSDAIAVCLDLATALGQAHAAGITHGGVKPSNVFFAADGSGALAKITDFGSRLRSIDWQGTPEAKLAGSDYSAPETLSRGVRDVRADVYSLGCVLHAMLVGSSPSAATTDVLGGVPKLPEKDAVDRDLNRLLATMLDPEPSQRPADMSAVREALTNLGQETSPASTPAPVTTPPVAQPPMGSGAAPALDSESKPANPLDVAAAAMVSPESAAAGSRRGVAAVLLGRGARRVGAAALAAAVVIALLAWWTHRDKDDDTSPSASATPTSSPTTSDSAAATPVKVTAKPAYRSVVFSVAADGRDTEFQQQGEWKAVTGDKVTITTTAGAEQACVRVRLADGGKPVRACGKSKAPELAMEPVGACTIGTTQYTKCYELTLAGFKPGPVKVESSAADAQGVVQHYTDDVTVDSTGHGRDQARFGTSTPATVEVSVAGVTKSLSIG